MLLEHFYFNRKETLLLTGFITDQPIFIAFIPLCYNERKTPE